MTNISKTLKIAFLACLVVGTLASCASSKRAARKKAAAAANTIGGEAISKTTTKTSDKTTKKAETKTNTTSSQSTKQETPKNADFVPTVNANRTSANYVVSDMKLKVGYGGKSISCGGTFRMKRNDVIQLNLTYKILISINVGTLELTRDSILLLDRINNQYIRASYDEIPYLKQAGINFYSFQSLFWGELFKPNDKGAKPDKSDYDQSKGSNTVTLSYGDKNMAIQFLAGAVSGLISRTTITTPGNSSAYVKADYSKWKSLSGGKFPGETALSISDGKNTYTATITLDDLEQTSKWEKRTSFNAKKYKKVSVNSIIRQLMNVGK